MFSLLWREWVLTAPSFYVKSTNNDNHRKNPYVIFKLIRQENQHRGVKQADTFFTDTLPTPTPPVLDWGPMLCIAPLPRRCEIVLWCKNNKENFKLLRNAVLSFCFRTLKLYNKITADLSWRKWNEATDKVVKDVVILLYNPTKTVGVKKRRLKVWYKLPGIANNGCYKDEGKCMGNPFSKPTYVWTLLCDFSSESWDLIVFDWAEWYLDGWQSIFSFYKELLLHVFISGKVVTIQRKSQNM